MTDRRSAVITGLGVRTPFGSDPDEMWSALLAGRSAARTITRFDTTGLPVDFACVVPPFDPAPYLTPKEDRRFDPVTRLGVSAAQDAVSDAGGPTAPPERRALVVGESHGGAHTQESVLLAPDEHGRGRPSALYVPKTMLNATAAAIAVRHGIRGPSLCVATACASGGHAVGEALRLIRDGSADVVLVGGVDAYITPTFVLAFHGLGALSTRTRDPEHASRPFDTDREGFVFGEGAAFLVIESPEHAERRGARVHAELSGYGRTTDAYHLTAPDPDGDGIRRAMLAALRDARITADDVAHVNAHATSTQAGDLAEARAIAGVFGPHRVPVTSCKGAMGHLIGAAGAVEAVVAALTLREGLIPPTANTDTPDPLCEVDIVTGHPRKLGEGAVVSNSLGFGGHNAAIVLRPAS
ncbi:beta-ketoacyl-[acyl-carrier-protein] synthase family protein [Nocardiopsis mangrovi]|uniref:Beta-ketoacyl-[acyl-carrier-protein] synthase family protein n=1 Tax=Nocardiopsis mangrovi TaxID=1179818 RepID=A0ABV9E0Y1_9ACTN